MELIIKILTWVVAPLFLLGVLILVHEIGHFLACRATGVKVERFSLGFGPELFARQVGETRYRLALFPLGGYVKPLGEEPDEPIPPEEFARSLPGKSAPARFLIFLAGPLANLLLPLPIFFAIALFGAPALAPLVGTVKPGSPAESAGFAAGDRILTLGPEKVKSFDDLARLVRDNPGQTLAVGLERAGRRLELSLTPVAREGVNLLGEAVVEGEAGILPGELASRVAVRPGSPAERAGLRTGDLILSVDSTPTPTFRELQQELQKPGRAGRELALALTRDEKPMDLRLPLPAGAAGWDSLGLLVPELYVAEVVPGSPAARAGLEKDDRIIAVDGKNLARWDELVDLIQAGGAARRRFLIERAGRTRELSIIPEAEGAPAEKGEKPVFKVGIRSHLEYTGGQMIKVRELNPFRAGALALAQTWEFTSLTVRGIVALVEGRVSVKNVGSPILIVKLAGDSARSGWYPYVFLLIIISINLGLINLFPIPIMDGGQIVLLLIEVVIRRPLSLKAREVAQTIGFGLVLLIISVAVYNDLVRFQDAIFEFFDRWF